MFAKRFALVCLAVIFTFLYTAPLGSLLLQSKSILTDGTDSLTSPFQAKILWDLAQNNRAELLRGGIYTDRLNAPEGDVLLIHWAERFLILLGTATAGVERAHLVLVFLLSLLNIFSFYWLARDLGWNRAVAFATAVCFAFNPFTRARIAVHPILVALYQIPLVWLAVRRLKFSNQILLPASLFFLAATTAHYHLISLFFMSPIFIYLLLEKNSEKRKSLWRAAVAALPALALTIYSVLTIPKAAPSSIIPEEVQQQFMNNFAALPIDYFTGDVEQGALDINPLRATLSSWVLSGSRGAFPHETAYGIRWLVWVGFIAACLFFRKRNAEIRAALFLAGFAFFFALPQSWFPPSSITHALISEFRIPGRIAVFVHFALLLVLGQYLNLNYANWSAKLPGRLKDLSPAILTILAFLEFPPLMPLPTTVLPTAVLVNERECGSILALPYASGANRQIDYFRFLSALRGSNCRVVNRSHYSELNGILVRAFSKANPANLKKFLPFFDCAAIRWLYMPARGLEACEAIGWKSHAELLCENPTVSKTPKPLENCVSLLPQFQ